MKNRYLLSLIVGTLTFFPVAEAEEQFRLGVSSALSGVARDFGTAAQNGFLLAQEEQPERMKRLELLFEDDRYDAKTALNVFHKFRTQDRVDMVFVAGVAPSEAVAPLAERLGFPVVANCQNPTVSQNRSYVIRSGNYSEQYSKKILDHLRNSGAQHIGIVKTQASYNDALISGLESHLSEDQALVLVAAHDASEMDFRTSILKLKQGAFDATGVYLFPGQLSSFFKQAQQLRLNTRLFGSDVFESRTEIEASAGAMDGAIFAFNSVDVDFQRRYRDRFGDDLQIGTAANSYDIALLLAEIVGTTRAIPKGKTVLEGLRKAKSIRGVSGTFSYQDTERGGAYFDFPIEVKRISKNEILAVSDIDTSPIP